MICGGPETPGVIATNGVAFAWFLVYESPVHRGLRGPVRIAAMPLQTGVRHCICDPPIELLANRIVSARQSPGGCQIRVFERSAPGLGARLTGGGNVVELPEFFPGERVVRGDEAGV